MRLSDWRKKCYVRFRRLYEENLALFQCQFGWRSLSQFRFDFSWSSFHTFICYWDNCHCLLIWHLLALVQQWLCSSHDTAEAFGSLDTEKDFFLINKWDSQLSWNPPFIKLQVSLPGPHIDEELESSTSFRNNFPGMTFPKNRISISLKLSPRKLDCPAFPNYHCLEQPHLPSHTRGAGFAIFHMYLGTPQLSRNEW